MRVARLGRQNFVNCNPSNGSFQCANQPISALTGFLEDALDTPVIDQTGLANHYNINFNGSSNHDKLKQTVLDKVGLELVPARMPVEFLVVDKAN